MNATLNPRGQTVRLALETGAFHGLVDAASAAILYSEVARHRIPSASLLTLIVLYNVLAFGAQWLLGALADARGAYRGLGAAGAWTLVLATLAETAFPWFSVVLAGLGNACFHVGAGGVVLRQSGGRAWEAGLFGAPGALGLAVGIWLGVQGAAWQTPCMALLLLSGARLLFLLSRELSPPPPAPAPTGTPWLWALVLSLLTAVALRSTIGGILSAAWRAPARDAFALALAAAGGKSLGGLAADRLGWRRTSILALLLAAPLVLAGLEEFELALVGMVLFQFTMPVTLGAVYRAFPKWPGLAFGLPSLALLLGALPGFTPVLATHAHAVRLWLGPAILFSAALVYFGLSFTTARQDLWDGVLAGVRLGQFLHALNRARRICVSNPACYFRLRGSPALSFKGSGR